MAEDEKKKKVKGFKEFDPSSYIDIEPTIDEAIANKIAVVTFGRMNPITVGHEKLANKVMSVAADLRGTPAIFLSHSQDSKKNPLSYDDKVSYAIKAFGSIVKKSPARTIIEVAKSLQSKFGKLVVVVGSDRVKEFETLLNKYNGKDYKFNEIRVVSAGERDPDSDGVSGMSASKMREFAVKDDINQFAKGLPSKLKSSSADIMSAIRKGLNMSEEVENMDEALTRVQRFKRARTLRRVRSKIIRGQERAKRRKADMKKIKKRARKAAIMTIKNRLAKPKKYANLSYAEKERIDKRMEKIPPTRIERIARKMIPMVKKREAERLASRGKKEESVDINSQFENFMTEGMWGKYVTKRPHMLYQNDGKVKFDKRFKMFQPKNVQESIESELEELMEATEMFAEWVCGQCNCDPCTCEGDGLGEAKDTHMTKDGRTAKKGLWYNIHQKRKRGEAPAKPGDKDYPKTLDIDEDINVKAAKFLEEKLKASDDMGKWVKDFQDSDAPQFKGKSQKKRQQMAVAAKLSAERNEEVGLDEAEMSLYDKIKAARANPSPDKPVRGRGSKNRNPKTYDVRNTLDKEDDRLQGMVKKKLKKEEVELEEDVTKMSHSRLKWHMNTGVPHGSFTKAEMKKERDRRLKTGEGEAYKKAKPSMSEEVEQIDEISRDTARSYIRKASADNAERKKEVMKPFMKKIIKKNQQATKTETGERFAIINDNDDIEVYNSKTKRLIRKVRMSNRQSAIQRLKKATYKSSLDTFKGYQMWYSNKEPGLRFSEIDKELEEVSNYIPNEETDDTRMGTITKKVKLPEEVEQLDELSPNTLHSYIKKAAGNMAGNSAVAATQASSSMKKASPDVKRNIKNRMRGITGASGRLADKANQNEDLDELSLSVKDLTKSGINKAAAPNKDKLKKDLASMKKRLQNNVDTKPTIDEVSTEKLRDYASAALQDKNKAKADKRWKYASKAMKTVGDREAKAAHARKYNKMEEVELDEISREKMADYANKAIKDKEDAKYQKDRATNSKVANRFRKNPEGEKKDDEKIKAAADKIRRRERGAKTWTRKMLTKEEHGAGDEGTDKLIKTFKKDTPGEKK